MEKLPMVGQPDIKYIILVDQGMCVFVFILRSNAKKVANMVGIATVSLCIISIFFINSIFNQTNTIDDTSEAGTTYNYLSSPQLLMEFVLLNL
jgi:hypothetical protein